MKTLLSIFARKLSSVKSGFAFISKAKKSFYKEGKENNLSGLGVFVISTNAITDKHDLVVQWSFIVTTILITLVIVIRRMIIFSRAIKGSKR